MFRIFNAGWYSSYIQESLKNLARDKSRRDICRIFWFLFMCDKALGGRLKVDYMRDGVPTEKLVESGKEIKDLARYFDSKAYIPKEYKEYGRKPDYNTFRNITHPDPERYPKEAKKYKGKSQEDKLLSVFKKSTISDFTKPISDLMRVSFYVPVDFRNTLESEDYQSEAKKFFTNKLDNRLWKQFQDWKFTYRHTFLINAEFIFYKFVRHITYLAYNKIKNQLSIPERRAIILLYFPRLGEYAIPIFTRKWMGFLDFKPEETAPLIEDLIFKKYGMDKEKKEWLYKKLDLLFREYLDKQYGKDLIRDSETWIQSLRTEDRRLESERDRWDIGEIGRKKEEVKQRKKKEALKLKGVPISHDPERRTGQKVSCWKLNKEGEEVNLLDTVKYSSDPITRDRILQEVWKWVDNECPKKLREIAKLRYLEGHLINEVARKVSESVRNVKYKLDKIEKEFKKFVDNHYWKDYFYEYFNLT